jgi:RNA polymerase sigma factor (sigma-70 family)
LSTATPSLSDARLTQRAVRGSSRALEAIFERYHQELYRYCAAIVGNSADAQDAVQSTMVKVLQALPGERRQIELKPWLYRIAHNEAIEIIRRRVPAEEIDADSLLGPASAVEQVELRDRLRQLVADVAELPERQRGALVMRELGGLGFEQIGAALGTSAATARQTVYEARLGLRQIGAGREMDCAEATRAISDGDRRLLRGRKLRSHLRACGGCRAFRAEIEGRRGELALIAPLPATAAAGILHGVLGGAGAAAGGGAIAGGGAAVAGGVAGKSLLSAAAIKSAAAIGVLVALGVTAADRGGLIDIGAGRAEAPSRAANPAPPGASDGAAAPAPPGPASVAADRGTDRGSGAPVRNGAAAGGDLSAGRAVDAAPVVPVTSQGGRGTPPSAVAPGPEAPPGNADKDGHLGQLKHPDAGAADEGIAPPPGESATEGEPATPGSSAAAPGHTKPNQEKPAPAIPDPTKKDEAKADPAKPGHEKPSETKPPAASAPAPESPHVPPGQAKKTAPTEAPATAPVEAPAGTATATETEAPAVAEPVTKPHGKPAAAPSTP